MADQTVSYAAIEQDLFRRQTLAQERIATALESILVEAKKQSGYQLRIAISNECLCDCCTSGSQRSEMLIEATMTNAEKTALERFQEYLKLQGDE